MSLDEVEKKVRVQPAELETKKFKKKGSKFGGEKKFEFSRLNSTF